MQKCDWAVAVHGEESNWIHVHTPNHAPVAQHRLHASIKLFHEPSRFGINQGRISKLTIWQSHEESMQTVPRSLTLFSYDRGTDVNMLNKNTAAKDFYDQILTFLN